MELICSANGIINYLLNVSALFLESKTFIYPEKQLFVDSGYQGIQNIHKNTFLPFKKVNPIH